MLLTEALPVWQAHLKHRDGKADTTLHDYLCHVRSVCRWLGESAVIADMTIHALRAHLTEYERRHRPRSVLARIQSLRSFCAWLVDAGYMTESPAEPLRAPALDDPERRWPSDQKIAALVLACDKIADVRRAALSRVMILVCVHSGLRSQELLDLKMGDVDLVRGIIHIRHGKGNKPRAVYPHQECLAAIREWLRIREKDCTHDYLFALDRGRRVSKEGLRTLLQAVKAIAGYAEDRDLTPHCLRRAYATRLLRNGANLDEIRQAMGHSSVFTTGMYLYTSEAQMRKLADLSGLQPHQTHPEQAQTPLDCAPIGRPDWPGNKRAAHRRRIPLKRK